jgi:hypothetical protein
MQPVWKARLNLEQLQQSFLAWVRSLVRLSGGQVIAIDGKTLRQSYDCADGKGANPLLSLWEKSTNSRTFS